MIPAIQLPGKHKALGFIEPDDVLCISIIVTSRCNLKCSYCHFFGNLPQNLRNRDIQDAVFDRYLDIIEYVKSTLHRNIRIRFSGGEPLALGSRLFHLSSKVFSRLGERVFVLTNGTMIDRDVTRRAVDNGISAFVISVENPFDVDVGSADPHSIIGKISELSEPTLQLVPGIVIVRNHMFSKLTEIADYFFSRLREIPTLSELSFSSFRSPSKKQLQHLEEGIGAIIEKYVGKTPLELFPYVVPELAFCYNNKYLLEFGITVNDDSFYHNPMDACLSSMQRQLESGYPLSNCVNTACEWYGSCHRIKWVWADKMNDYCAMKHAICGGCYNALVRNHALAT